MSVRGRAAVAEGDFGSRLLRGSPELAGEERALVAPLPAVGVHGEWCSTGAPCAWRAVVRATVRPDSGGRAVFGGTADLRDRRRASGCGPRRHPARARAAPGKSSVALHAVQDRLRPDSLSLTRSALAIEPALPPRGHFSRIFSSPAPVPVIAVDAAAAVAVQVGWRSLGFLDNPLSTVCESCPGSDGRQSVRRGGAFVVCSTRTLVLVSSSNGRRPQSSS